MGNGIRQPRKCAAVATLVAALMLSYAAVHAAAAAPRRCATSGVRELAADARGRMYRDAGAHKTCTCACDRGDRPVLFADEHPELSNERVTSPYAAGVIFSLSGAPSYILTIADMRSRKQASKAFRADPYDLVLTNRAWRGSSVPPELNPDGTGPIGRDTSNSHGHQRAVVVDLERGQRQPARPERRRTAALLRSRDGVSAHLSRSRPARSSTFPGRARTIRTLEINPLRREALPFPDALRECRFRYMIAQRAGRRSRRDRRCDCRRGQSGRRSSTRYTYSCLVDSGPHELAFARRTRPIRPATVRPAPSPG